MVPKNRPWHDYVWMNGDKPVETLDMIYAPQTIVEMINNGFQLHKGEKFVLIEELPNELKNRIKDIVTRINEDPTSVSKEELIYDLENPPVYVTPRF